jgi:hypothetical protein
LATHIAQADILDESRVELAPFPDLLKQGADHVLEAGVLEAALLSLGKRRPDGQRDDDVVGILGGAAASLMLEKSSAQLIKQRHSVHLRKRAARRQVLEDGAEPFHSHGCYRECLGCTEHVCFW